MALLVVQDPNQENALDMFANHSLRHIISYVLKCLGKKEN
jgi:hypothetical protein